MSGRVGVVLALDVPSAAEALDLVDLLGPTADFYKVGLELFTRAGPTVLSELKARGKRVFLDLKLHDIPNTVARAVAAAGELDVELLTVHAGGGVAMLEAAAGAATGHTRILGVTVLTSMGAADLGDAWGRRVDSVEDEVVRLARGAAEAGMHGVVSSPAEAAALRAALGPDFLLVVPGIRPGGSDRQDQKRVATPADAVAAGADYLVVGRPVTRAADPPAALASLLDEVSRAAAAPA